MPAETHSSETAKSQPPRHVIFDLGGVLIDWNPDYLYRKLIPDTGARRQFLDNVCTMAWHGRQDGGRPTAEAIAELLPRFPDQAPLIRAFYERWEEMFGGAHAGTVALLEDLHRAGASLYALTNWPGELFPRTRPRFPFLERFRQIVISGDIGMVKPHAEIFHHTCAVIGAPPGDCVFIDDSAKNVDAAAALGFHTHRFTDADGARAMLRGHGFAV